MSISDYDSVEQLEKNAELVFGLVAPMGTDAMMVAENLASQLLEFGTSSEIIRLSDLIATYSALLGLTCCLKDGNEFERISTRIVAGNEVSRQTKLPPRVTPLSVRALIRTGPALGNISMVANSPIHVCTPATLETWFDDVIN